MKKWLLVFSIIVGGWFSQALISSNTVHAAENALDKLMAENAAQQQDNGEPKFLDRDKAFEFSADLVDNRLLVRWKIADNYYLYQERFKFKVEGAEMGKPVFPKGKMHYDEFAEKDMEIYYNFVEVQIPVSNITSDIKLTARYQGCAEAGLCYTPAKKTKTFITGVSGSTSTNNNTSTTTEQISGSATDTPETSHSLTDLSTNQNALANYLKNSSILVSLGLFLLLGLALTFTPCVFPMMPILASIVAGQGKETSPTKAFWLSFVYVQGMAITYVALGVLTASAGHSLAGVFQSVWVVAIASIIFILLALSMFGFYELKLPSGLQSKLSDVSNQQTGGTFFGVAIMGLISALIVSPCMSAPLAGVLLHIADTGDYVLGGLYMYAMAMGIGIPLIIIGVSEGKFMPKAGAWMDGVKYAFGVGLLAVAITVSDHLLPGPVVMVLWGLLLLMSGVYLGAFESRPENTWPKFWKGIGLFFVLYSVILFVGAAQGNTNPLKPLANNGATQMVNGTSAHANLPFVQVKSLAEINAAVKKANSQGKTVMLDLFADWCTACSELAEYTFPDPRVRKALKNTVWLQADVGDDSIPETLEIMQHFKVLGLPSVMFFNVEGKEQTNNRVIGYLTPEDYVARVHQAFK